MLKNLIIAPDIRDKLLDKHQVKELEVHECFLNNDGFYIEDTEEDHRTDPPTEWFVAQTDRGRWLKVVFVFRDGNIFLKSAFDANPKTKHIYSEVRKKQE